MKHNIDKYKAVVVSILLIYCTAGLFPVQEKDIADFYIEDLLDTKIEISSIQAQDIFSTPSTVSVIDADMVRRFNFTSIAEALNYAAGITVMRTYLKRDIPTSRGILQDNYANKVLLLINGIPTWNAVTGEGYLARVDIQDIERIEILKGPASVLYGTNAYSGAINIVLKKVDQRRLSMQTVIGEKNEIKGGGNMGLSGRNWQFFAAGHAETETGSDFLFSDETGTTGHIREFVRGSNATFNAKYRDHNFLFNGGTSEESYLGVTPAFSAGAGNPHRVFGYLFSYQFRHVFKTKSSPQVTAGVNYDWGHRSLSRSLDDTIRADITGFRISAYTRAGVQFNNALHIESGIDYDFRKSLEYSNKNTLKNTLLADNNMKGRTVYETSAYGQLSFKKKQVNLLLGGRYTYNEAFGGNMSWRGTFVYTPGPKNSLKFIWGQSFRAPSLFELYFATPDKTVFGNINLEPEKSNSWELAYLTSLKNFFVQVLVYYAHYDNKIFRVRQDYTLPDGTLLKNVNVYINGSDFNAKGLELEIRYQKSTQGSMFFNYSFVKGNHGDEYAGNQHYNFKYIPQHQVSMGIEKTFRKFFVSGTLIYQSSCTGFNTEIPAQAIGSINAGVRHTFRTLKLIHTISLKNIGGDDFVIPEYVRLRTLNDVPSGYYQRIMYTLGISL